MFKDVRRRLTIIYTTMTGTILIILTACLFFWNIQMKEQEDSAAFQNVWLSVSSHLQTDTSLSHSYLAQMEASNRAIIHIEDNGTPLLYRGSWSPDTSREELIQKGTEAAREEGVLLSQAPISSFMEQTPMFKIQGSSGDFYFGKAIVAITEYGSKSLLLLTYIAPRSELVRQSLPLFLMVSLAGVLLMFLVSWFFAGWSLKPAEESARKQTDFIAAASHELRSPLAVIRSCVSALSDDPGECSHTLLSNIDKESRRMARLVSDMLLLASSDAGNWTLQKKDVELDTLLIESYESFLPICREKHLELQLELPEESLPVIQADRQRLEQVLTILLDNAVSYTPEGGQLKLKGYRTNHSKVAIEVIDSGPGIPDNMKHRIFDRFYRGDQSRSEKKHFGLGLCIAKELVELHCGNISVSDREGGGSRFIIYL